MPTATRSTPPSPTCGPDTPVRWRLDGSVLGFTPTLADGHHRVGLFRLDDASVSVFAAPEVDLGPPVRSAPVEPIWV